MPEMWRFIANMIRKQIEQINDLEELRGRTDFTRGLKTSLCSLLRDLAEYYDSERIVDMEKFLRAGMGLSRELVRR